MSVKSLDRLNLALQVAAAGCALLVFVNPFFGIGAAILTAGSVLTGRYVANRKEIAVSKEIEDRDRRITSIEQTASAEIQRITLAASSFATELEAVRNQHRKSTLDEGGFVWRLQDGPKGRVKITFPWGMPSEYYALNENDAGKTFTRLVKLIRRGGWCVDERIPPAEHGVSAYGITLRAFVSNAGDQHPSLEALRYAFEHSGQPVQVDLISGNQSDEIIVIVGAPHQK